MLESVFSKVAGLKARCFPLNIAEFLRTSFFIEHLWWLLLIKIGAFIVNIELTHLDNGVLY